MIANRSNGATMTRVAKLYAAMLANRRAPMAFRDFARLLAAFGFVLDRTRGSHRQYVHPAVPRAFPVQPGGKDAKPYQVEQFIDMIEEFGLSMES